MSELHLPWLELAVFVPLLGALAVSRVRNADVARRWALVLSGLTLLFAVGAWQDFVGTRGKEANDPWRLLARVAGRDYLVIDELNAPLLALTAFLYFLTVVATPRTKVRRSSFAWGLVSEAIMLATLACKEPWGIVALLAAGTVPPYLELRARRKPTRVFAFHMALFVCLLAGGWAAVEAEGRQNPHTWLALVPLLVAVFIRCGLVPVHCWMTDLFEHATFGTALLFVTPMPGAYAAVRLVLPISPDWVLRAIGIAALFTALYAAGMALVQREARRFFCYLFLSHSALVLVGMDTIAPIGLTGALCVWLSVGLALAGFGLTLRSLEGRHGRLSLADYHGLYEHTPALAVCFLLTGLTSVGFPGTFGFLGTEMLVDGAVQAYPYVGVVVIVVAALNGIAVVWAYFRLFTGARHVSAVPLGMRPRERFAVLALAALILLGGLFPQPGVASRHQAALDILRERAGLRGPVAAEAESAEPEPVLGLSSLFADDVRHEATN
jgi:NADH-quinone oxidoreductase subunit M